MMGNLRRRGVTVVEIHLHASPFSSQQDEDQDRQAAYAAYIDNGTALARIMVLNLHGYNSTVNGAGIVPLAEAPPRPSLNYTFTITDGAGSQPGTRVGVRRLWASGSDAITGITWDGWSYNYELAGGRPVRLANVTVDETAVVSANGSVAVSVPHSSAVLLDFMENLPNP